MSCEKYQNLISELLDGELDEILTKEVHTHLSMCIDCARTHEDFASILEFSDEAFREESAPPNSQALWCRINNIIETEIQPGIIEGKLRATKTPGLLSRFWNGSLQLTPSQVVTSFMGIALVSSLLTVVGIKNFTGPNEIHADQQRQPNLVESMLSSIGLAETPGEKYQRRIEEQKSAIAYWKKRVEMRRVQWDSHLQKAFDRNLQEINKAVNEYTQILRENPQDKISSEMLDSALSEKMEFLREFAEL